MHEVCSWAKWTLLSCFLKPGMGWSKPWAESKPLDFSKSSYILFLALTLRALGNKQTITLSSSFSYFPHKMTSPLHHSGISTIVALRTVLWPSFSSGPAPACRIPFHTLSVTSNTALEDIPWWRSRSSAEHIFASSLSHFVLLNLLRKPPFLPFGYSTEFKQDISPNSISSRESFKVLIK